MTWLDGVKADISGKAACRRTSAKQMPFHHDSFSSAILSLASSDRTVLFQPPLPPTLPCVHDMGLGDFRQYVSVRRRGPRTSNQVLLRMPYYTHDPLNRRWLLGH